MFPVLPLVPGVRVELSTTESSYTTAVCMGHRVGVVNKAHAWLFLAAVSARDVVVGLCSVFEQLHDLSVPPLALLHARCIRLRQVLMEDKQS